MVRGLCVATRWVKGDAESKNMTAPRVPAVCRICMEEEVKGQRPEQEFPAGGVQGFPSRMWGGRARMSESASMSEPPELHADC
jgi:hypothetical protein